MSEPSDNGESGPSQRIPTLFQYAQRVAALHVDAIESLAHIPLELVKPILPNCSAQQLARFEKESPQLRGCSPELWMMFCLNRFPVWGKRFQTGEEDTPVDWREQYLSLEYEQTRRMEELSSKLRNDRMEAERLQKGKDIITDKVPTSKRPRWGFQAPPKTLFQKTMSEAGRTKTTQQSRTSITNRIIPNASATRVPILPAGRATSTVTTTLVTTTIVHRSAAPRRETMPASSSSSARSTASASSPPPTPSMSSASPTSSRSATSPPLARRSTGVPSMRSLSNSSTAPSVCLLISDRPTTINEAQDTAGSTRMSSAREVLPAATYDQDLPSRPVRPLPRVSPAASRSGAVSLPTSSSASTPDVRPRAKPTPKKDPLAGLFIPKQRTLPRPTSITTR